MDALFDHLGRRSQRVMVVYLRRELLATTGAAGRQLACRRDRYIATAMGSV
jgi:hypothetical protein